MGSGKTSLASVLATRLAAPRASFGDYVRSVAVERGLDAQSREVLQDLGNELIAGGWDRFCTAVLNHADYTGGPVVVDGIRHLDAITNLELLVAPLPFRLVAVEAQDSLRLERLAKRGVDTTAAERAEAHSNEAEVLDVMRRADFRVSEDHSVEEAADLIIAWVET